MRRYKRIILLLFFMLLGTWLVLPGLIAKIQVWFKHLQTSDAPTSATANTSLVYTITPNRWLKFAIPEQSSQLRIISNADIQSSATVTPDMTWDYALSYEILDKKGKILNKGLYHQRSRLTTYQDAQNKILYSNYYANPKKLPLDGRLILLALEADAAYVRLGLETVNPAIIETAVRVYVPTKISKQQLATSWLRMSQAEKDNLAKHSIYPASLISTAEKNNLLKHQWQPIGPLGIEDKDYQAQTLYTLKDLQQEPQNELMSASGLQADAQHIGVIPLPEHGGDISLNIKALDGSALTTPVSVKLQWFGRTLEQRWQQNAVWSSDTEINYRLEGGLLVINPSAPIVITAYLTSATEAKHDITDALLSTKSYLASAGVDFDVLHLRQHHTAFRVDVRRLLNSEQQQQATVHYQWLNAKHEVIAKGELNALDFPSLFDRIGPITQANNISDPTSYYFKIPAEVTRLHLQSSDHSLFVSAYNQPFGVVKNQRIPEDAYVDSDKQDLQLTWFPLSAVNDQNLSQQQSVLWISGQYRPPEDDPERQAGNYVWEDFIPEGETSARYLLSDYSGQLARSEALASVYCTITANRDSAINLGALNGLQSIAPELIFLREQANPFNVELFINRQKRLVTNSIGRQGIIQLPEMGLGKHLIRLNTDSGGQWLMNYQKQCIGKQYLKRRVFSLTANSALDFVVQHQAQDEVLSARLYSPNNTVERSQLKVDINPNSFSLNEKNITTRWTYLNRLYDIRPLPGKAMPMLYSQGQSLSNGEIFSIPLNSDLPAGSYHIRMTLAKGATGFVTLSQIKSGSHEQRRFYRESNVESR